MEVFSCRTIGEDQFEVINEIIAYPNPASDQLNVSFTSSKQEKYSFKIVNVLGDVMFNEVVETVEGENIKQIDLHNFSRGIYFLAVDKAGTQIKIIRIAVD
ncbi:hypothetical protein BH11BAC1_BH11BAC1_00030 [soil metagenome]